MNKKTKKWIARAHNIEGHSGHVWLHAQTNGIANDQEITTLLTSECTSQQSKEHKEQNEK